MNIDMLKNKVLEIASQNPVGFTYDILTGRMPQKGYVVAAKDTQDCIGNRGLFQVIKFYLHNLDYCIGGWRNEDGTMQFDASKVYYDLNEAITAAVKNEQRAIFNLYTKKVIMAGEYSNYSIAA